MAALLRAALSLNPKAWRYTLLPEPLAVSPQLRVSGKFTPQPGGPVGSKTMPDDWGDFLEQHPEFKEYHYPDRSDQTCYQTLLSLCENMRFESEFTSRALRAANLVLMSDIPTARPPDFVLEKRLPHPQEVLAVILDMSPESAPGYPFCLKGSKKREIGVEFFSELYFLTLHRLLALKYLDVENMRQDQAIEMNLVDPVLVTVKNEPTKVTKPPRLVFPVGFVDEIIDRLYFTPLFDKMKERWGLFYSCIGIGFGSADSDVLHKSFEGLKVVTNDSPKFDVTRTLLESDLDVEAFNAAYELSNDSGFLVVNKKIQYLARNSTFILPEGAAIEQVVAGMMKSGEFKTSLGNTTTRSRRATAAALVIRAVYTPTHPIKNRCAGDDCLEAFHEKLEDVYKLLGFTLRDFAVCDEFYEFCSHEWRPSSRPIGQRIVKSMYRLLVGRMTDDQVKAFVRQYINHPRFREVVSLAAERRSAANLAREVKFVEFSKLILKMPDKKKKSNKKNGPKKVPKPNKIFSLTNNAVPLARKVGKPKNKPKTKPAHVVGICRVTDPFCPAARNAKWPDGTGGPTVTEQLRGSTTISTVLATGKSIYCFSPAAPFGYLQVLSYVGNTATMQTGYQTYKSNTMLATYGNAYRLVSFGCIVRCTASATNAQGIATIATSGVSLDVSGQYVMGTENWGEVVVKAIQPGMEVSWISKPSGSQAREFVAVTDTTTAQKQKTWSSLIVEVDGGPGSATPLLNVEWYMNIEFTLAATANINGMARLAESSPAAVSLSTRTANSVGSIIEGGVKVVEATIYNKAESALNSFLSDPLESLAGLFL